MSYYYMPIFRITKLERIPVTEASDKIIKLQKSLYITRWKVVRPHRTTSGAIGICLSKSHTMQFFPRLYTITLNTYNNIIFYTFIRII